MPNRDLSKWWKIACEKNPDPIVLVDINDKFLFANIAFCELIGWSQEELKEKTWIDITKNSDVGVDQKEMESILNNGKSEYYLEKTYITKSDHEIDVCIYVHRYPDFGNQEGYIVFVRKLSSKEYETLRDKFYELQKTVITLQKTFSNSESLSNKVDLMNQKLEHEKELNRIILNKGNPNINIGDNITSGRDSIKNDTKMIILVASIIIIGLICFTALLVGGVLDLNFGNSNIKVN